MFDAFLESFAYVLPALVTGAVAYYMFKEWIYNLKEEKKVEALVNKKKETLPIKLQAYERLLLFCERIEPIQLLKRVKPISTFTDDYISLLTQTIQQEYEHNLVQQLYVSDECWTAITSAKQSIIIKLTMLQKEATSVENFQNLVLSYFEKNESPTKVAVVFIKNDVKKLL